VEERCSCLTQEGLLQKAKEFQKSEAFKEYCKLRQVAEHRFARLMQLGIRQARDKGREKSLFQLRVAATVANLTPGVKRNGANALQKRAGYFGSNAKHGSTSHIVLLL
jgi:hypothetical protein